MVLRLATDQCSMYWDDLKKVISSSLPPTAQATPEGLNEILMMLMSGKAQAWMILEGTQVRAAAITLVQTEAGTQAKNLLIYALAGYANVQQEMWQEGLEVFKRYAKSNGCAKVIAFTKVPRVREIAEALGATMDFTLLEWEA